MEKYKIEYVQGGRWYSAGHPINAGELKAHVIRHKNQWNNGEFRAFRLKETQVFPTIIETIVIQEK
jgi:hypothetical protein